MVYRVSSDPALRRREAPARTEADRAVDESVAGPRASDADERLYAVEASSDYDPGPYIGRIEAPLLAVNSADDLINPPEFNLFEREIRRVPRVRAVLLP